MGVNSPWEGRGCEGLFFNQRDGALWWVLWDWGLDYFCPLVSSQISQSSHSKMEIFGQALHIESIFPEAPWS